MKNFFHTLLLLCTTVCAIKAQEVNPNTTYNLEKDISTYSTAYVNNNYSEETVSESSNTQNKANVNVPNIGDLAKEYNVKISNLYLNTDASEFSPMFAEKGVLIYASTRKQRGSVRKNGKKNHEELADIYKVILKNHKKAGKVKQLSRRINTRNHEATISFTPNKNKVYYTKKGNRVNKNGKKNLMIYKSVKKHGKWDWGYKVPFCSKEYSVGHPSVSPDGSKLYFVSDMPGGFGETDIYVVDINNDGSYSDPRNLGPSINSPRADSFPYITRNKLYFSSNRNNGEGGLDLYEATIENGEFTEAINMGAPFNTSKDDFGFIIQDDFKSGFFSSNRAGGKGSDDIYSFDLTKYNDESEFAIEGLVEAAKTNTAVEGVEVRLIDKNNKLIDKTYTDANGKYQFSKLKENGNYVFEYKKDAYRKARFASEVNKESNRKYYVALTTEEDAPKYPAAPVSTVATNVTSKTSSNNTKTNNSEMLKEEKTETVIDNTVAEDNTSFSKEVKELKPIGAKKKPMSSASKAFEEKGQVFGSVYYGYNQSFLTDKAESDLSKLVTLIKNNPDWKVRIESHTDVRGSKVYNKMLSEKRSQSVKECLIAQGLNENNIDSTVSYGEDKPLKVCKTSNTCSEEAHKLNRRTEIIIIK